MARLYVSEETHQQVKVLAASAGVSMQEWVESRLVDVVPPTARLEPSSVALPVRPVAGPPSPSKAGSNDMPPTEPLDDYIPPVRKLSPFEARAAKRKAPPTIATNEFGDPIYDD